MQCSGDVFTNELQNLLLNGSDKELYMDIFFVLFCDLVSVSI